MSEPHVCPLCKGTKGAWTEVSALDTAVFDKCEVCHGTGIVWEPDLGEGSPLEDRVAALEEITEDGWAIGSPGPDRLRFSELDDLIQENAARIDRLEAAIIDPEGEK